MFVAARPPSPALGGDTTTGGRDTGAGCTGDGGVVGVWGAETVVVLHVTVTWAQAPTPPPTVAAIVATALPLPVEGEVYVAVA